MAEDEKDDFFGMSDDDFLKLNLEPAQNEPEDDDPSGSETEGNDDAANAGGDDPAADGGASGDDDPALDGKGKDDGEDIPGDDPDEDPEGEEDDDPKLNKDRSPDGKKPDEDDPQAGKDAEGKDKAKNEQKGKDEAVKPAKDEPKTTEQPAPATAKTSKDMKPEELASFYDEVMKPFKANGREINLRSPDEAIRLMQMGAGYGRKLQDMQPHLKTLRMLEKNSLLSEDKLSHLIELDKKNPDAIKKLIKDSGIDPLDLDMEDNANYRPKDHSVSDGEVAFSEALKEVTSQTGGRDTIQHINSTWDKQSKEFLWGNPEVLTAIQEQRTNGVYATITAEIDRKRMLGEIAPTVPFLEAYKIAGDALVEAQSLNQPGSQQVSNPSQQAPAPKADQQAGRVLGTRTAAPKSSATNSDKAKAASSTPSSSRKAKDIVNPLEMADDDFLKQFDNRL